MTFYSEPVIAYWMQVVKELLNFVGVLGFFFGLLLLWQCLRSQSGVLLWYLVSQMNM